MKESKLSTIKEISKMIGVKAGTIYVSVKNGGIKHYRIGRRIYLKTEDVDTWIKSKSVCGQVVEVETIEINKAAIKSVEVKTYDVDVLSAREASEFALLSVDTIMSLIRNNYIKLSKNNIRNVNKIGRPPKYLILKDSLIEYMKTQRYNDSLVIRKTLVSVAANRKYSTKEKVGNNIVGTNLTEINRKLDLLLSELGITVK